MRRLVLLSALLGVAFARSAGRHIAVAQGVRPSIVLVPVDDLDAAAIDQIPRLKSLLIDQGATLPSMCASVPLCRPVRSSLPRGTVRP